MDRKLFSDFLMAVMPIFMSGFCMICITLLASQKWIAVLLQIPIIAVQVWYIWELHLRRQLLEELADD